MDTRFRRIAVFAGVAALATGAGVVVAGQGGETTPSQAATQQQRAGDPGRAPGHMDLSALADELGVSTDELDAAMQAVRSSGFSPQPGADDPLAAALADELGLPVDKVTAALEAVRPQRGRMQPPDGSLPPSATPPDDPSGGATTTPALQT